MGSFLREDEANALFSPKAVAIAGVSRNPASLGRKVLNNLINSGYQGKIFVIHPRVSDFDGIPGVKSLKEIPEEIDVVVSLVPRSSVMKLARDCVKKGVRVLVVISAGFSEVGGEGTELENELLVFARDNGMRLIGPNSMGVYSGFSLGKEPMDLTFTPIQPVPGSLAFLSQSGAIGAVMANHANQLGLGFSRFISLGNKPDIDENVLLEFLKTDDQTDLIAFYLESFADGRRFIEICREISQKKPLLAVKSGRTEAGARAAASHTGALASSDAIVDAVFNQSGIIRANDISDLAFLAYGLSKLPIMKGNRVAVISNAGGPGTIQTDELEKIGLKVSPLSEETKQNLNEFLPLEASTSNPIDILPSASPEIYRRTAQNVLDSEDVDAAVILLLPPVLYPIGEMLTGIGKITTSKPVIIVAMGCEGLVEDVVNFNFPVVYLPNTAALVLNAAYQRGIIEERKYQPNREPKPSGKIEKVNGEWLDLNTTEELCSIYGIPQVQQKVCSSWDEIRSKFIQMSSPVVLKAVSEKLIHKSDLGGVITGVKTEKDLAQAFSHLKQILEKVGDPNGRIMIQEQVQSELEIVIGGVRDPQFGPMIMVGTGGTLVEVFNDVKFHIAPLTQKEAIDLIEQTKLGKLLSGVRGREAYDKSKLASLIVKVGEMLFNEKDIEELDMNPVLIQNEEFVPVDIRVKIHSSSK